MTTCRDIDSNMTAYVDCELPASEAAAVDEHLDACGPCRERSQVERAARALLTERAAMLSQHAPPGLQARCRAAASSSFTPAIAPATRAAVSTRRWRAPLSVAAAAVLVVAATFAFLRFSGQAGPVLAAELALDHTKCFALAGDATPTDDLASLEQSFEQSYGWRAGIPVGLATQGVEMIEARRCPYHDGQMAHVLCRLDGQPMSLFVMPQGARAGRELETAGHQVIMWGSGDRTYALVGQQTRPALQRVASSIRGGSIVVP